MAKGNNAGMGFACLFFKKNIPFEQLVMLSNIMQPVAKKFIFTAVVPKDYSFYGWNAAKTKCHHINDINL